MFSTNNKSSPWINDDNSKTVFRDSFIASYKHTNEAALINKISIIKNTNETYSIMINLKRNERAYFKAIKNIGYPRVNAIDRALDRYTLQLPNVNYLTEFLNAISATFPDVKYISDDLINAFKPHSKEDSSIIGWHKTEYLNNTKEYQSCMRNSKIISICTMRLEYDLFEVAVKIKRADYEDISSAVTAADNNQLALIDRIIHQCHLKVTKEQLKKTLDALSKLEPSVSNVIDHVYHDCGIKAEMNTNRLFAESQSNQPQFNINGERIDSPAP